MLVAEHQGSRVEASEAIRGIEYRCPACDAIMVLKRGRIVVDHFAHAVDQGCQWGRGETREHLQAKMDLANGLRLRAIPAQVEYVIRTADGIRRADVFVAGRTKTPVAFELQHTPLTVEQIEERAWSYANGGVAQIWVPFLAKQHLDQAVYRDAVYAELERFPAKELEKWVHGFGLAWGMWMYAPHDGTWWLARLSTEWRYKCDQQWIDEDGEEQYRSGGFYAYNKARRLHLVGPFNLGQLRVKLESRPLSDLGVYRFPKGVIARFVPSDDCNSELKAKHDFYISDSWRPEPPKEKDCQ